MGRRRRRRRRRRAPAPPPPAPVKKAPTPPPSTGGGGSSTAPQTAKVSAVGKSAATSRVRSNPINISKGSQRSTIAPTTIQLKGQKMEDALQVFGGTDKEYGAYEKPPLDKVPGLDADVSWGHNDLPAVFIDWSEYLEQDEKDRVKYYKIMEWVPGKAGTSPAPRSLTLKPLDFWNKYVDTSKERDKDKKRKTRKKTPKFRFSKFNNVMHGGRYGEGRIPRGRKESSDNYRHRVRIIRAAGKHRREMEAKGYDYSYKTGTYKRIKKTKHNRRYFKRFFKTSNLRKAIEHKKKNRRRRRRRGGFFSRFLRRRRRR